MDGFDQVHDPGLQQERTVLAWDRTALALMVASGLLARVVVQRSLGVVTVIPAAGLILGLLVLILDRPRYLARRRRAQRGGVMTATGLVTTVGIATVVLGVTALAVVVAA